MGRRPLRGAALSTDEPAALADRVAGLLEAHPDGVLPIVQLGDPVLRRRAAEYTGQLDAELLARFVAALRTTMHAAPGVGLAAPQVGVPLQIAVLEDRWPVDDETAAARDRVPLDFRAIVNPRYEPVGGERATFYEGCLSFSGFQGVVSRSRTVRLLAADETGAAVDEQFTGWAARIVQHETDHLYGMVYIDRALTRSLTTSENYVRYWADPTPARAKAGLGF